MFLYGTNSLWAARQGIAELRTAQAWSDLRRELRELTWHHKVSFFISKRLSTCWPTMFIRPFCPYHVKGPRRVRISGWWWWYEASTLTLTRAGFIWFWTDEKDQKWFSHLVWTMDFCRVDETLSFGRSQDLVNRTCQWASESYPGCMLWCFTISSKSLIL